MTATLVITPPLISSFTMMAESGKDAPARTRPLASSWVAARGLYCVRSCGSA